MTYTDHSLEAPQPVAEGEIAMLTTVDSCFDPGTGHHYQLTVVCRAGEHTVRVRVRRDHYAHQSHAIAEVLTPALTWTVLAHQPTSLWWRDTPNVTRPSASALQPVADAALGRALAVLGHAPSPGA